ncbi:TerD family protein [Actinomadura rubrisoli]|uniref:TerD family protein n=1 Tax=Actinomadura rubrisoli TaxID=2530368 RepID=A0A4R5B7A1_9ACTN|nr:TerD family protein [Actinomadura rubrisoli]TDD79162.1 TerD family protein [Actinomadura rubrisoli]
MQRMLKGSNVELANLTEAAGPITVALRWSDPSGAGEADVAALLVGASGKVRGDDDLVFYNQPASPDGTVQLLGKAPTGGGSEDRILLDLAALPSEVERVVVTASRYAGATFGELDDLGLTLFDSSGAALLGFDIGDAGTETAFVFGELYRRGGGWKFRAVGQGYESGLAGLAADFGISVDDSDSDDSDGGGGASGVEDVSAPGAAVAARTSEETAASGAPAETEAGRRRAGRVRTAKKRSTLPKAPKVDLADHPAWQGARLFSCAGLRNDHEREARATSTLMAVMAQVPEFGRRLTARFNAPAGTVQTFVEATFKHGDGKVRPDGVIRVARAGRIWTALVETKTGGNPLRPEQVEAYLDVAARNGYEAVITLSNDLALDGEHPLTVDKRRLRKVALRHLSWAEVAHEAHMLCHHHGLAGETHAWLLGELLHYLRTDNAGCQGFQDMGPSWVPLRNAIAAGTLRPGDQHAVRVAESWERLVRQLCLRLSGETGHNVAPVTRRRRGGEAASRRSQVAASLIDSGRMGAEVRMPDVGGPVRIEADLRTGQIETAVEIPSAVRARALTRVHWLLRQLDEAPPELRVEALTEGRSEGPCDLVKNLRSEPGLLVPGDGGEISSFRLTLPTGMGTKRGTDEAGFVRSVDLAVDRFHQLVLQAVEVEAA